MVADPFRRKEDLDRLRPLEPELDTPYVIEAVRILAGELDVPLIGFAGGPFTVASYLVEGGPSKNFTRVKALMHGDPAVWHQLVDRLTDLALASLRSQLDAGASAVQVFDSWAGILAPHHYEQLVLPATTRLFAELAESHPGDAHHPVRRGHRRAAAPDGHGRQPGGGHRLAGPPRRGQAAGRVRGSPSRATSTRPCA